MKKILSAILALTLVCGALVGCGDDADSSSKKSDKSSTASVAEDSKADESKADDSAADSEEESKADSSEEESVAEPDSSEDESSKEDTSSKEPLKGDKLDKDVLANTKWEGDVMVYNGVEIKELLGVPIAVMLQIEFDADANPKLREDGIEEETGEIEWALENDQFKVKAGMGELIFVLIDGKLVADYNEGGMTAQIKLKKVDEFTKFDESAAEQALNSILDAENGGDIE